MSTFQPRIHSPPARQAYSPKLTPSACLSPPNSGHHSKKPTKQATKSPISNKDKRSPTRNSTLRSQYDTKLTDACSPTGNKAHGPHHQHQGSTVTGRKNQQNLKEDKQKVKNYSEHVMPFDKPRRSDHHLLYPHHDSKVPYKQKSHSVKSVCVPQELLLSPKSYDPNLAGALLSKKVQTAKHSSRNEADLQAIYNMDLLTLYHRQMEENRYEERTNKGNKFFASTKQKKENEPPRRKVNTPEASPPGKGYNESKKKFENKVSPRAYELLVGSPARYQNVQQQQKVQKSRYDNYMQGPLPDIEEQCEENVKASSEQSKTTKGSEVRMRTGSVPNEIMYEDVNGYSNSRSPVRPKTTKHSEANIYSDNNRVSDIQAGQAVKTKYVSSTRSALGRFENQFNSDGHVEENEYEKEDEREQQGRQENQFMADLLKGNTLRELKLNPNAKFLLLREQVRERRNRTGFKSADWNATEEVTKLASQHQTSPTKGCNLSPPISPILCQSPNMLRSADVSASPIKSASKVSEDIKGVGATAANEQLVQIFNKTKNVLATYKNKEKDWEKERKLFVAEIKRLRGLLNEALN